MNSIKSILKTTTPGKNIINDNEIEITKEYDYGSTITPEDVEKYMGQCAKKTKIKKWSTVIVRFLHKDSVSYKLGIRSNDILKRNRAPKIGVMYTAEHFKENISTHHPRSNIFSIKPSTQEDISMQFNDRAQEDEIENITQISSSETRKTNKQVSWNNFEILAEKIKFVSNEVLNNLYLDKAIEYVQEKNSKELNSEVLQQIKKIVEIHENEMEKRELATWELIKNEQS